MAEDQREEKRDSILVYNYNFYLFTIIRVCQGPFRHTLIDVNRTIGQKLKTLCNYVTVNLF